jgi:hypothetical protein
MYAFAQAPTYYHDSSLDAIQNNAGYTFTAVIGLSNSLPQREVNAEQTNAYQNIDALGLVIGNVTNASDSDMTQDNMTNNAAQMASHSSILITNFGIASPFGTNFLVDTNDGFFSSTESNTGGSIISLGTFNAQTYNMDLSLNTGSYLSETTMELISQVVLLINSLIVFVFAFQHIEKNIFSSLEQRQTKGASQAILGTNATVPTGLVYAAIVTSSLVALLGLLVTTPFLHTSYSTVSTLSTQVASFSTMFPACDVLCAMTPVVGIFSIWLNYLAFRYVYSFPLFFGIRCVIFWLIS